ncbi:MAG: exo-alpha-sialidase [Bryobacteraceae bacterium]|nr:exo-alpha-sialidase [Bryobacteraceae bacterium]
MQIFPLLLTALALHGQERGYTIPLIDLAHETARQVIVDRDPGQYLGHPTTLLLEDGRTMLIVYPKGHGKGGIVMKRSTDAGLTWSERLPVPENWATSRETPTIHRVVDAKGRKRIVLFSGLYPIRSSISLDDGREWTPLKPIGDFGGIVAMGDVMRLNDGRYMAVFHDDGRFLKNGGKAAKFTVFKTLSSDGGLTWRAPEVVAEHPEAHLCEPGLIRSPDGRQIAMLLRENSRKFNSFVTFSSDEGRTWTTPRQLPGSLTGDRHVARYGPDGRLFITFRDTTHESPTRGDWVAWVGKYDDIAQGREGQYRVRLMDNTKGADCCYPGLEVLGDGTFVTTTYGHWTEGQPPYIASVRLKLGELDQRARVPFDTPLVKVVRAANVPGQKSRLHKHDLNRVMVHLDAGRMRLAFQGGPDNEVAFGAGEVRWDPKGGLHTSENTGGSHYRIIEIELKNPGVEEKLPAPEAPGQYSVELENQQVRILRARYGAGESSPLHRHTLPRVVVFLTPFHVRSASSNGRTTEIRARAGDVMMLGADEHTATNLSEKPFEVVIVELKSR